MKIILMCLCLLVFNIKDIQAIEFQGKAFIVMDSVNKIVLSSKNEHHIQSVASISKIMTAIIAIENGNLNDMYTIAEEVNEAWGSGVYIQIGERISLRDLLYGLMLRSGNDAANTIAVNIAGSIEEFVSLMNEKAKALGLNDTIFSNPTGLDEEDDGNKSSVYDMALLMSYCTQNPIFNEIINTESYKREDGGGTWHNKNRLLEDYEYCVGGKTGFTKKAKRTLITRAIKDNVSLIIVTFNCGNDFEFHEEMYEKSFIDYKNILVLPKGIYQYQGHSFLIDQDLYSPIKDKDVSFIENTDSIEVNADQYKIYEIKKESQLKTILKYFMIVLGDMING